MKKSRGFTSSKMISDLCSRNVFSYLFSVGNKIRSSCSFCLFFCGLQELKRNQARVFVIAVFVWSVVIRYFFVHILFAKQKLGWNDFCKVFFFSWKHCGFVFSIYRFQYILSVYTGLFFSESGRGVMFTTGVIHFLFLHVFISWFLLCFVTLFSFFNLLAHFCCV